MQKSCILFFSHREEKACTTINERKAFGKLFRPQKTFLGWWYIRKPFSLIKSSCAAPECTKIARFSAVAAAIFTAPPQNRAIFKATRCAISSVKKIASERRFSLRLKGTNLIPTAEFPAIPESAAKIASERRCAILVHSVLHVYYTFLGSSQSYTT